MARRSNKSGASRDAWKVGELHAPRRSAHQSLSAEDVYAAWINLSKLCDEFPQHRRHLLDDQRLIGQVRLALGRYHSARQHSVPRIAFRRAGQSLTRRLEDLRGELKKGMLPETAHAAVLQRVDEIVGVQKAKVVAAQLEDLSVAIGKALQAEPERGNIRDEPARGLVYDLSEIYRLRTGKKPTRTFDHSMKWYRASDRERLPSEKKADGRSRTERELDGNEFARFVLLIEGAYLDGLRAHWKKSASKGAALGKREIEGRVAKFALGQIRKLVISVVDARRKERWR